MAEFQYGAISRNCPVELVFGLVGQRWKARTLFLLSRGPKRFNALAAELDGVSDKVMTTVLRDLVRDGFAERRVTPTMPVQVEYAITEEGLRLWQAMEPLRQWGLAHKRP